MNKPKKLVLKKHRKKEKKRKEKIKLALQQKSKEIK